MPRVRVRGIYATALTERLRGNVEVVAPSATLADRFDEPLFGDGPPDCVIDDGPDRRGVGVTGPPDPVALITEKLSAVGRDAFGWSDPAPEGAVFEARVTDTLGSGAVVDLGPREGFLPYDATDRRVETGDELRVQVREPAPPWADRRSAVAPGLEATAGPVTLVRGADRPQADVGDPETATALVRMVDQLSTTVPDGWAVRFERAAPGVALAVLDDALAVAAERAAAMLATLDGDPPPLATDWVWFGRESRFALDDVRRRVTTTMPGHHRLKAATGAASAAVDFVETLWGEVDTDPIDDGQFPFDDAAAQFGPTVGDRVAISHGKPDGRRFALGVGEVTDRAGETVTLRREMTAGGEYDGLGVDRAAGDVAITRLTEGKWWYPTVYHDADGGVKGTYVNVCTPVELFPDAATYVDLEVDVVRHADGTVERLDDAELEAAVEADQVPAPLAEKARAVAAAIERGLTE